MRYKSLRNTSLAWTLRPVLLAIGILGSCCVAVEAVALESVSSVGCPSDGQMGPLAPRQAGPVQLELSAADASRLGYYTTPWGGGVLAPRDWRCFFVYGSNGSSLVVAPNLEVDKGFDAVRNLDLLGPAVVLDVNFGGTSGRFAVAQYAARLFSRQAHDYIERVAREQDAIDNGNFRHDLRFAPYPADRLVRKSPFKVEFETPAWQEGLGTSVFPRLYASSPESIYGVAILSQDREWPNLLVLAVRLPKELRSLRFAIVRNTEFGKW